MSKENNAKRQRELKQRRLAAGWMKLEKWIPPSARQLLEDFIKALENYKD